MHDSERDGKKGCLIPWMASRHWCSIWSCRRAALDYRVLRGLGSFSYRDGFNIGKEEKVHISMQHEI